MSCGKSCSWGFQNQEPNVHSVSAPWKVTWMGERGLPVPKLSDLESSSHSCLDLHSSGFLLNCNCLCLNQSELTMLPASASSP